MHSYYIISYRLFLLVQHIKFHVLHFLNHIFRALPILIPILSPKGSIEIPEPIVKKLIPKIKSNIPNKNNTKTPALIGARLTLKMRTIAAIGKTENTDSFNEFKRCFKVLPPYAFVYNPSVFFHYTQI